MRNHILVFCLMYIVCSCGCGSLTGTKGDVTEYKMPSNAGNPKIAEFNLLLDGMTSEARVEKAINGFVNYVTSRLDRSSKSTLEPGSPILMPDTIRKIVENECASRGITVTPRFLFGVNQVTPLIDVGTVRDTVNQLGSSEGFMVNDEMVIKTMAAVQGSIPNLKPYSRQGMTPLEAMVVGYALVSCDDGTASEETVDIPAEKMTSFVDRITR